MKNKKEGYKQEDIDNFFNYGFFAPNRTIYMGGSTETDPEIDAPLSERIVKCLHILDSINGEPITFIINSVGGSTREGTCIYDAIKSCKSHVTVRICGSCMSMASIIMLAADKIEMTKNSTIMLHYGTDSLEGHPKVIKNWVKHAENFDKWCKDLYMDRIEKVKPNFGKAMLDSWLNFDKILNAEDSLKYGLIDEIV